MGILDSLLGGRYRRYLRETVENTRSILKLIKENVMPTLEELVTDLNDVETGVGELVTLYTDLKNSIGTPTPEQQVLIDQADAVAERVKATLDAVKNPAPTEGTGETVAGGFARRSASNPAGAQQRSVQHSKSTQGFNVGRSNR